MMVTAVQITSSRPCSERLRRPYLRKASGFPAHPVPFVLLRTVRRPTDCAEEVVHVRRPLVRPSLSANQAAELQSVAKGNKRNEPR